MRALFLLLVWFAGHHVERVLRYSFALAMTSTAFLNGATSLTSRALTTSVRCASSRRLVRLSFARAAHDSRDAARCSCVRPDYVRGYACLRLFSSRGVPRDDFSSSRSCDCAARAAEPRPRGIAFALLLTLTLLLGSRLGREGVVCLDRANGSSRSRAPSHLFCAARSRAGRGACVSSRPPARIAGARASRSSRGLCCSRRLASPSTPIVRALAPASSRRVVRRTDRLVFCFVSPWSARAGTPRGWLRLDARAHGSFDHRHEHGVRDVRASHAVVAPVSRMTAFCVLASACALAHAASARREASCDRVVAERRVDAERHRHAWHSGASLAPRCAPSRLRRGDLHIMCRLRARRGHGFETFAPLRRRLLYTCALGATLVDAVMPVSVWRRARSFRVRQRVHEGF